MSLTDAPPGLAVHPLREVARGGLAGLIAGIVMGGVGGRLVMRVSGLIDPSARGRFTEGGARVGEVTLAGTVGLVVFVGILSGLLIGVIWVVTRPWLPSRGGRRYAASAAIAVAMGARLAVEGRNIDFLILDPALGQAALFVALAALTGVFVAAVDGWLERRLPPARGGTGLLYGAMALVGTLLAVPPVTILFFSAENCDCVSPPRLPGALLIATGLLTLSAWIAGWRRVRLPSWAARAGSILLGLMVVAGLLHLGGEIAHFV